MIHIEKGKINAFEVGDFSDITKLESKAFTFEFEIENSVIIAEEVNYQIQYLQYLEDKKMSLEELKFYKNYWENNTLSIQYIKDKW